MKGRERFMLPKPKKAKKAARPKRDEFELEEIVRNLTEALEEQNEVVLFLWQRDEPLRGKIEKMDGQTQLIHVRCDYELLKIKFKDLLEIKSV